MVRSITLAGLIVTGLCQDCTKFYEAPETYYKAEAPTTSTLWLAAVNSARAQAWAAEGGVQPAVLGLAWNDEFAAFAIASVKRYRGKHVCHYDLFDAGENMSGSWHHGAPKLDLLPKEGVTRWWKSQGHFSAMQWRDAVEVGCGCAQVLDDGIFCKCLFKSGERQKPPNSLSCSLEPCFPSMRDTPWEELPWTGGDKVIPPHHELGGVQLLENGALSYHIFGTLMVLVLHHVAL